MDVPVALARGLRGEPLLGEWPEWLAKLSEYVRQVHATWNRIPRRVCMTDGEWLVIFENPEDAFLSLQLPNPDQIRWYGTWEEIQQTATEIFGSLEYHAVLGEAPALPAASLPFHIGPGEANAAMHGLRLVYQDSRWPYEPEVSTIRVAPVLFLRTRSGSWLRVETFASARQREIPRGAADLGGHLDEMAELALDLRREVDQHLGESPRTWMLAEHFRDQDAFDSLPGVRRDGRDAYLVATGEETHFLRLHPTVPDCPWHDWNKCGEHGVAEGTAPAEHSIPKRRLLFVSRHTHHCAHLAVMAAKVGPVTDANRSDCGSRSAENDGPFCELFPFEQHLCCRTCVFEQVCTASTRFHLPCIRPPALPEQGREVADEPG
jgi:hypothetical protein